MTGDPLPPSTPAAKEIAEAIFKQVMGVMGLKHPTWITRCLYPLFYIPLQRLSRLLVALDRDIVEYGWNTAMSRFMAHFVTSLDLHDQENIPAHGPLMVVCNHPAALDVVILIAAIKRDDLKVLISDIPVLQMVPHLFEHCIPVYYDLSRRTQTIRDAVRHLEADGALFFFPRGNVEPDPAVSPGAEKSLAGWSASTELFLRSVPKTLTVVATASGMLSASWYKNPLVQIWKKYEQRQKVAEIFQIAAQLFTGKTPAATPTVSFSTPFTVDELGGSASPNGTLLGSVMQTARIMLKRYPYR